MNPWKKFWTNPYRWGLWHWVGKRQWTFILRDFAYQNPMLVLMIGFGLGIWLRPHLDLNHVIPFLAGMLIAHLFWGTRWRKGQGK